MTVTVPHAPVLVQEMLEYLQPRLGGKYLDGTLGFGGHAGAVLEKTRGAAQILGLDRDQEAAHQAAVSLTAAWPHARLAVRNIRFSRFAEAMDDLGWKEVDGALLDLGVSSHQVDTPQRGFSFLREGPLDMRMDACDAGLSAEDVVNAFAPRELARIISAYGEEPLAGRIARRIEQHRQQRRIVSTLELARIVESAYPPARRARARNHPATRTFQALRMFVNDELGELNAFLEGIIPFLVPDGRLVIVSFHSLEDRIVKHFFQKQSRGCHCPPMQPLCQCGRTALLDVLTKKPVTASSDEVAANPRSRSAKLRAARKRFGA